MGSTAGPLKNVGVSNLVLSLDAGNINSYPRSGTTWTDLSGNNRTGTLTNGPTFNVTSGGSIVFDGSNDYVDVTNTATAFSFADTTFTVSIWFKQSALANGALISKGGGVGGWSIWAVSDGTIVSYMKNGSSVDSYDRYTSAVITPNTWINIVAIFTTSTTIAGNNSVTHYVNGVVNTGTVVVGSGAYGSDTSTNLYLGRRTTSPYFSGDIASVQIYDRALTAAEILQNYNGSKFKYNTYDPLGSFVTHYIRGVGTVGDTTVPNLVYGGTTLSGQSGSMVLSDTRWKWGGVSMKIPSSATFTIGAYSLPGDFTLEMWYYASAMASDLRFIGGGGANQWGWGSRVVGTRNIGLVNDGVGWYAEVSYSPILNAWTHLAVSRSGTTIRYFHNGTLIGTSSLSGTFSGANPYFQDITGNNGGQYYNDVRITKFARYTAAFTAPTSQFMLPY